MFHTVALILSLMIIGPLGVSCSNATQDDSSAKTTDNSKSGEKAATGEEGEVGRESEEDPDDTPPSVSETGPAAEEETSPASKTLTVGDVQYSTTTKAFSIGPDVAAFKQALESKQLKHYDQATAHFAGSWEERSDGKFFVSLCSLDNNGKQSLAGLRPICLSANPGTEAFDIKLSVSDHDNLLITFSKDLKDRNVLTEIEETVSYRTKHPKEKFNEQKCYDTTYGFRQKMYFEKKYYDCFATLFKYSLAEQAKRDADPKYRNHYYTKAASVKLAPIDTPHNTAPHISIELGDSVLKDGKINPGLNPLALLQYRRHKAAQFTAASGALKYLLKALDQDLVDAMDEDPSKKAEFIKATTTLLTETTTKRVSAL